MHKLLEGKRVLITGASRGLGAAIAEAMGREGASLLLVARSQADLSDPGAPRKILTQARRLWPRIDIVVNNAAIAGPMGMIADNDWDRWRETIQVNLLAPAEITKLAIEWMRETGGGGSVINISGGGAASARPGFSAYATAKCGLARFTETVAAEVAPLGIRVNSIAPGAMNTAMREEIRRAMPESLAGTSTVDPCIAADLAVYLASERAAGITGKLISAVWDGWRELDQHSEELRHSDVYTLRRILPADRGKAAGA
jgi:NAD(P)-dependent dehydrogenase (short-subunit alcohol dehydrogenase family)